MSILSRVGSVSDIAEIVSSPCARAAARSIPHWRGQVLPPSSYPTSPQSSLSRARRRLSRLAWSPPSASTTEATSRLDQLLITPLSRPLSRLRKETSTGGNNRANCNAQYYENHSPPPKEGLRRVRSLGAVATG